MILAQGGVDKRWGDEHGHPYLGVPKQLVEVDGETLIGRTVRLLQERGVSDIIVTAPEGDERFRFDGVWNVTQDQSGWTWPGINALHGTRPLWSTSRRTTLMFGDVYYTDQTADLIVACDDPEPHWFRRTGPSKVTGHRWDEPFAFSFLPCHHDRIVTVAAQVVERWHRPGKKPHLWHHQAAMLGIRGDRPSCLIDAPHQTAIDDWTDDIDSPRDWRAWMGRRHAGAYDVAVVVPWTGGDDRRRQSFDWTVSWWQQMGLPVFIGEDSTGGEWPNRSAARNHGARQAFAAGADLVFHADSDTFIGADQLWAAAHMAATRGQLVLAFSEYVRLPSSQQPTSGLTVDRLWAKRARRGSKSYWSHASGAVMVPRKVWETVGGYDERFTSWGGEDRAFWLACNLLCGEAPRIDGPAWHWWHPRAADNNRKIPTFSQNVDLGMRYKIAAAYRPRAGTILDELEGVEPDPDAMWGILGEPGGPLDPDRREGGVGCGHRLSA